MNNAEYAKSDVSFNQACEAAGIPATKRQAGKYRREVGAAFQAQQNAKSLKIIKGDK